MPAKILLSSFLFLIALSGSALACGVYEVNGTVRFDRSGYRIVTAEGSRSETRFAVPAIESMKLVAYKDMPVKASVLILKPFNGTRAQIAKIQSVADRVPDPLRGALDSNSSLKKRMDCKK